MQGWIYNQLRTDKGLINLEGCALGDGGCRRQYFPRAIDAGQDPEAEKQFKIRNHLWGRTIGGNGGFASLWDGTHETSLGRVCVGPGAEGTYFLTIFADPTISGDGRLSASDDGYMSKDSQNNAVDGVDDFGWWVNVDFHGCFCAGDDAGLPSGIAGLCTGAVPECAGRTMPPAIRRTVKGYTMVITQLSFAHGVIDPMANGGIHMGCVSYGQWRYYTIETSGVSDGQILIKFDNLVGGIYASANSVPNLISYEMRTQPPQKQITLSPCDALVPTTWHFAVMLGEESEGVMETRFTMTMTQTSSVVPLSINQVVYGSVCCDGYSYTVVPNVPSEKALSVNLTVQQGAVHALLLQYDSCPTYVANDRYRSCEGLCEIGWVTKWDTITGARQSLEQFTLTVPMGERVGENDERHAGAWYVGVKALPGERADYRLDLSLRSPNVKRAKPYCSSMDRFCASSTQRYATLPISTAAEARSPGEAFSRSAATMRAQGGGRRAVALAVVAAAALLCVMCSISVRSSRDW